MRLINVLLLSLILTACGTTSKKSTPKSDIDTELEGLTNESFEWPQEKGYNTVDDFLDSSVTNEPNVLVGESVAKVSKEELESPMDVPRDIDKAMLACYRGNFNLADQIFDRIMREYRKNPIYWNQVGNCFMMKGSMRKALLYFNKARDLKSFYTPPVNNIGVIFEKNGFYQKALKSYEEAKKQSSFSLTPIFNLAQVYARFGFINEGKKLFESLVRINAKDDDALFGLAFFELASGDSARSLQIFEALSRDYRGHPEVAVNLAYALYLKGDANQARDILSDLKVTRNPELNDYIGRVKRLVN